MQLLSIVILYYTVPLSKFTTPEVLDYLQLDNSYKNTHCNIGDRTFSRFILRGLEKKSRNWNPIKKGSVTKTTPKMAKKTSKRRGNKATASVRKEKGAKSARKNKGSKKRKVEEEVPVVHKPVLEEIIDDDDDDDDYDYDDDDEMDDFGSGMPPGMMEAMFAGGMPPGMMEAILSQMVSHHRGDLDDEDEDEDEESREHKLFHLVKESDLCAVQVLTTQS